MQLSGFRVLFDRSAFHGARFKALRDSALISLVRGGQIIVHHTPAFLEETVSLYEKDKHRSILRDQLPFILDVCNGGWFLQPEALWHLELVQQAGAKANVFEEDWRRRDAERRMREGALGPAPWTELLASLHAKDHERQKQRRQRELHVEMRHEFLRKIRTARLAQSERPPSARKFIDDGMDDWGWEIIKRFIESSYKSTVHRRWMENRQLCPFFTSFVEGTLFQQWHAMLEPNKKIDLNAQVDVQLLAYLHRADVVVSCDTGFMRDAFTELWSEKGKRLMATDEFVAHLGQCVVTETLT